MIFEHANYRAYLKATLTERTGSNPSYSMSAWARKLGIAPGFFSEVLNGKKNLSQEAVQKISHQLGLNARETEYFSLLLQQETTKNHEVKERIVKRLNDMKPSRTKIHNLQVDLFRAMADWYCFAILDLTFLDGFELNARNAARKLGITQLEAEAAIERLLRLELLSQDESGRYVKTKSYVFMESGVPHEAIRRLHEQLMQHATQALKLPKTQRKSRSEVLPIPLDILPEVEKILDETAEKITALARESASKKQEVYGLSLHFYPLSRERKPS